jgi:hypothetical protein
VPHRGRGRPGSRAAPSQDLAQRCDGDVGTAPAGTSVRACYHPHRVPPPLDALETMWTSDEVHVAIDRRAGVVWFIRRTSTLPDLPVLRDSLLEVIAQLDRLPRAELGLIVDTRRAIGRSDDAFEATMSELRPRLLGGFRRIAAIVRTAVGRLQLQRLARIDGLSALLLVTDDEAEALAHVTSP